MKSDDLSPSNKLGGEPDGGSGSIVPFWLEYCCSCAVVHLTYLAPVWNATQFFHVTLSCGMERWAVPLVLYGLVFKAPPL